MRCIHAWTTTKVKDSYHSATILQCIRCPSRLVQTYPTNLQYEARHPELKQKRLALAARIKAASANATI